MTTNQLSETQRGFFKRINTAAFNNPFSEDYVKNKAELADLRTDTEELALNQAVLAKLGAQLERCSKNCKLDKEDARLVEQARLFRVYLTFHTHLDDYIETQSKAGDQLTALPIAGQLLHALSAIGIEQRQAEKYIGLFYQTRRAYYFISREILGLSPCMQHLRMHLWNNLFTHNSHWYLAYFCEHMEEFSTLLLGATGTGKTRIAQAIGRSNYIPFNERTHQFEESFTRSFQSTNLSQFPASLIEAELFGHKKGAFTGAIENREGVFARCSAHGAVFIDEVGEIDDTIQVKLLNVLQDRAFTPVGSAKKQKFQGRVIAATNQNIEQLLEQGKFREDFYYRLCSDVITLPDLHQRLSEQPEQELRLLVSSILRRTIGTDDDTLIARIESLIKKNVPDHYHWPGNVRELEQCVRGICVTGEYKPVTKPLLQQSPENSNYLQAQEMTAQQLLEAYCTQLHQRFGTYEKVARISGLDRRTVKKYIQSGLEAVNSSDQ
ncbi:MAG: sigma 54-interacting transcriptional regulator [Gammaproteobacteria bacterium]|nr:sigma 54-interacting transcriptional regulator [Gammaproteobacteria bacterium]